VSAREPGDADPASAGDENFLSRWARRKAQSRGDAAARDDRSPTPPAAPTATPPGDAADGTAVAPAPTSAPAVELPDLDLLGEDSDFSAFLTPGVDAELRRKALRKLFSSPKFNVFDGLDTYRDDYTQFPSLGSVVTADMRHHVERLARKAAEVLDEQTAPAAPPVAVAATPPATHSTPGAAAPESPVISPDEDTHDNPA
jgi:hypothetical protein